MLNEMYHLLLPVFNGKAIWALLDYIGVTEGIAGDTATPWLSADLKRQLDELWSPEEYTRIPEDHLGAMLVFQRVKLSNKEFVPILPHTAREHVEEMGPIDPAMTYEVTPFGTGRIAIELAKVGAQSIIGMEESLLLYRIALINVHLFEIPALVYLRQPNRDPNVWNPVSKRKTEEDPK